MWFESYCQINRGRRPSTTACPGARAMETNKMKKCGVKKIIVCTGLTRAAKAGQKSILPAQGAQRTNQERIPLIVTTVSVSRGHPSLVSLVITCSYALTIMLHNFPANSFFHLWTCNAADATYTFFSLYIMFIQYTHYAQSIDYFLNIIEMSLGQIFILGHQQKLYLLKV